MRTLLLCLGFLLAAAPAFCDSGLDALSSGEQEIQARAKAVQRGVLAAPEQLTVPGDGEGLRCLDAGSHTELIPSFDPMGTGCLNDPLPDADSLKAAWDKVQALLLSRGVLMESSPEKELPLGTLATNSPGQLQKGLGRGATDYLALDVKSHWGDLAYVLLDADEKGNAVPRDIILSTYRAEKTNQPDGALTASRWDFQGDRDGRLVSVIEQDGIRFPDSPKMMWGQLQVRSDLSDPDQIYVIRWHQLLKSWADQPVSPVEVGTTGLPPR